MVTAGPAVAREEAPSRVEELQGLSIDQLAGLQVTSVAKSPQPLSDAPAAIYVITHDEIVRSGATSVPELLRLAPNLYVARTAQDSWVVAARGLDGSHSAQNFSDKLLVLIDGRTVYSPLFEGVYWDLQDVLVQDIDRVEVISGPGATLWGANAYSGVINIITKPAADTQGGLLEVGGGNLERRAAMRFGGKLGDQASWRVYAQGFYDVATATGSQPLDHWSKPQGGFRLDWSPSNADRVTLQGDAYYGTEATTTSIGGGDVLARWSHDWSNGQTLQVQGYYDRVVRGNDLTGGVPFWQNIYDLDVQSGASLGERHELVLGGNLRFTQYRIASTPGLSFAPPARMLDLADGFVQDTVTLTPDAKLTVGLKVENDPFSGVTPLPDARLALTPTPDAMIWAAVSRAIRSPTPFDTDVVEKIGSVTFLTGNPQFQPETLTAWQLGVRLQPARRLSLSVSAYYNVYDQLRSIELKPVTVLPLLWGNMLEGHAYGMEAWGEYQVAPWWRLKAGLNLLSQHLKFAPGATAAALVGISQAGNDPPRQAQLGSSIDLGRDISWQANLRYVGPLPDPHVPSYVELDSSLGWNVTDRVRLAVSGFNLLHERHLESPGAVPVPRSVYADLQLRF
jgi:iron complex outermembrane receptor protein